jgi:hypothetical protein
MDVVMSNATELCGWPRGNTGQGINISEDMDTTAMGQRIFWLNAKGFHQARMILEIQDETSDGYDVLIPMAVAVSNA